MKSLKLRLLAVLIGTGLTLGISHVVAQAACDDRIVGGNAYGNYDCRYSYECAGWCYYTCSCSNLFPGYTCKNVLVEAGFEIVESPQC
jgi:hypothetical protein